MKNQLDWGSFGNITKIKMNKKKVLDYSVIVEWSNALTSDKKRPVEALRRLVLQMQALKKSGELLVLCSQDIDFGQLGFLVRRISRGITVRIIETEYTKNDSELNYKLKNKGVFFAKGKIATFMDSDLFIEPNWLRSILSPFKRKDIQVVAGITYLDTKNFYHKSMALTWLFPLRSVDGPMYADKRFWGNNVAARKEIWKKYPYNVNYPSSGSCVIDLAERLVNDGIVIWKQPSARASHPAPNSLNQFVGKALGEGLSIYFKWRRSYKTLLSFALLSAGSLKQIIFKNVRLFKDHRKVKMPSVALPVASLISVFYYFLVWCGGIKGMIYQTRRQNF